MQQLLIQNWIPIPFIFQNYHKVIQILKYDEQIMHILESYTDCLILRAENLSFDHLFFPDEDKHWLFKYLNRLNQEVLRL